MPPGVVRSLSAPPRTPSNNQSDTDEETCHFPVLTADEEYDGNLPGWNGVLPLDSNRQSRASSIISTRTRFSTTTLDEVRSIEINAGGHTFRISRDGSQVTNTSAPPPYPGSFADDEDVQRYGITHVEDQEQYEVQQTAVVQPGPRKRVRIVMPGDDDVEVQPAEQPNGCPSDRVLTRADLYQIMLELPLQLKRVLGIRMPRDARAQSAQELTLENPTNEGDTTLRTSDHKDSGFSNTETQSLSAPGSSHYGLAAFQPRGRNDSVLGYAKDSDETIDPRPSADTLRVLQQEGLGEHEDVHMTVGDLNELSLLYNGVMRDLDREHRKRLHERDKEMERLRSMLNEKDIVYRQELRGKDFIIEDLKNRLTRQEDSVEQRLESARNEVEDVWEKRWKTQESHLMEREGRKREEGTERIQAAALEPEK